MGHRFTGTYEELKNKLDILQPGGEWQDVNENQKQFRHQNGGVINWYPSTGSLNFQGKSEGRNELEKQVGEILSKHLPASLEDAPKIVDATEPETLATTPDVEEISDIASEPPPEPTAGILEHAFTDSELAIGLVGAVSTELNAIVEILTNRLQVCGYAVKQVRISRDVIPSIVVQTPESNNNSEYARISKMMDAGNQARINSQDNSILALGVSAKISSNRPIEDKHPKHAPRVAYIISSLKHPEEVQRLRQIYPQGFYLLGVHADEKRRHKYLVEEKSMEPDQAQMLMDRDEDEHLPYGQRVTDTFHMSDFFVRLDGDGDHLKNSIRRILDILLGHPYMTPTFDEYAMFLAFSASLRSADLSRQVGAVVARDKEIMATGANDCPKPGGGLYWPKYVDESKSIVDKPDGRDYKRGEDSNQVEQQKIIDDIVQIGAKNGLDETKLRQTLGTSRIRDLTEFGRVVHAEMEALLCCARNHIDTRNAELYCTTFPCHNCAKHIIAAGISRVVYIEPYQKSKASEFHSDAIFLGFSDDEKKKLVRFEPFVGVGPRRFFDLFSIRLGSGYTVTRKDSDGQVIEWKPENAQLRMQMLPCSYLDLELVASDLFRKACKLKEQK
ncbi:MAG: cytidine deaminase [Phycisphaerales bacterium]|jgi:deoxycytidylate deaminase|nr:cytidine deaminase [Phycisphaerales bacterium]